MAVMARRFLIVALSAFAFAMALSFAVLHLDRETAHGGRTTLSCSAVSANKCLASL